MSGILDGRVAVVTGAAGGIGAAVAHRLAAEGASVALTDIDRSRSESVAKQIIDAGGTAKAYHIDVASGEAVQSTLRQAEADLGLIDIAVTGAGVIDVFDFVALPETSWDRTIDINLKGTFLVFQAVARRLLAEGRTGGLVAIASVAARRGRPNTVDYAVSKAGVITLVQSAMKSLSPHGITVNAVCPGVVDTPMTRKIHEERAPLLGLTPEQSLEKIKAMIPLGRTQTPEDVANVVAFLVSPQGSYITGQAINACGGLEVN